MSNSKRSRKGERLAKTSKARKVDRTSTHTTSTRTTTNLDNTDKLERFKAPKKSLSVQETCDWIAELSESILENPESAFVSITNENDTFFDDDGGPSKMQHLLSLAQRQETKSEQYTAQLAITSLLLIFKDIIPAYRIRVPTAQEMAVKVSKDTKRIWDHERALLHHYQIYLKLLQHTWDAPKSKKSKEVGTIVSPLSTVSITAMLALTELLKSAFHFNFRSNLITAVVRQMNHKSQDIIRSACCQAVRTVFAKDAQGEVALEVARQVAKLVRDRQFRIHPDVLRTFVALPLRVHVDEAQAAKLAAAANAKKRKRDKEEAAIADELKEGSAKVDKIVLARCQSETLQTVTLTYFRVLKHDDRKASHVAELLPPALEGLAKFAHLINMDTVMDLLDVLKELLQKVDKLPLDATLNCILTAFQTLQGPGKEMKIDLKEYIVPLYSQVSRLASSIENDKHTDILLHCLQAAFIQRREYSTIRVAAFLKVILTTSLHTHSSTAVPLIALARQLIQRYPAASQMLENEQDVITEGTYTPVVDDPEHSNPFATSAWELALLRFHWDTRLSTQAAAAAEAKLLQLPTEGPERLRAAIQQADEELLIRYQRNKKKHPLKTKSSKTKTDPTKGQQRYHNLRFVKPRTRYCGIK